MKMKPRRNALEVVISLVVDHGRSGALSRRRNAQATFLMKKATGAKAARPSAHGNANRRNAIRLVLRSVDRLCVQRVARTSTPKVAR